MKASDLWEVRKVHVKMAYNDTDDYSVYNAAGECIVTTVEKWGLLNDIVIAHNKCFIEQEEKENG